MPRFMTTADCTSGAHSLSHFGDRLYPEMGNGGYASLHTDLFLDYDAIANLFLPGTTRTSRCAPRSASAT